MPQLTKGGKWVFGWVIVDEKSQIQIPPQAYEEYGFQAGETVLILRGSQRSGGFSIGRMERLFTSQVSLRSRSIGEAEIGAKRMLTLPAECGVLPGKHLLVARGSGMALGFLERGPIYEEALRHSEIQMYHTSNFLANSSGVAPRI